MEIGKKIAQLLAQKDWTKYRLSKLSGVDESTISRIVAGKMKPGYDNLVKIANALGVSMAEFDDDNFPNNIHFIGISEAELMPKSEEETAALQDLKEMSLEEQQRRILKHYNGLSLEQRKAIDVILRSLSSH